MRLYKIGEYILKCKDGNRDVVILTQNTINNLKADKMYFDTFIRIPIKNILKNNNVKYIIITGRHLKPIYLKFQDKEKFINTVKQNQIFNSRMEHIKCI